MKKMFVLVDADDQNTSAAPFANRKAAEKEMIQRFLRDVDDIEGTDEEKLRRVLDTDAEIGDLIIAGDYYGLNQFGAWADDTSCGMDWSICEIEVPEDIPDEPKVQNETLYTVTIWQKDDEMEPCTVAFDTREKAQKYKKKMERIFEEQGGNAHYRVTQDSCRLNNGTQYESAFSGEMGVDVQAEPEMNDEANSRWRKLAAYIRKDRKKSSSAGLDFICVPFKEADMILDILEKQSAFAEKMSIDVPTEPGAHADEGEELTVSYAVEGRYYATVILPKGTMIPDENSSCEEQREFIKTIKREASIHDYYEADFGELSDIDGHAISIEDVDGNILWEEGSDVLCSRRQGGKRCGFTDQDT